MAFISSVNCPFRRSCNFQAALPFDMIIIAKNHALSSISKRMEIAPKNENVHAFGKLCIIIDADSNTATLKEYADKYVRLSISERLKDLRVERHLALEQLVTETGL